MENKCPNCGYVINPGEHWNPPSLLPPVGVDFEILFEDGIKNVKRMSFAESKDAKLTYYSKDMMIIEGRYPWRYS